MLFALPRSSRIVAKALFDEFGIEETAGHEEHLDLSGNDDIEDLQELVKRVAALPSIPIPLYSCAHCADEYSHQSQDIAWSSKQNDWVCCHCWEEEEDGEEGASLRVLDEFHAALRMRLPLLLSLIRELRRGYLSKSEEARKARLEALKWVQALAAERKLTFVERRAELEYQCEELRSELENIRRVLPDESASLGLTLAGRVNRLAASAEGLSKYRDELLERVETLTRERDKLKENDEKGYAALVEDIQRKAERIKELEGKAEDVAALRNELKRRENNEEALKLYSADMEKLHTAIDASGSPVVRAGRLVDAAIRIMCERDAKIAELNDVILLSVRTMCRMSAR